MKKLIYIISLVFLGVQITNAQVDRSKPPKAGPARTINLGTPQTFKLDNGITVIVVENHKLPQVDMSLYLNNGLYKEGDKAGYFSMLGEMMRSGTKNYTKEQLDEALDITGSDFYFSASNMGVSSLTSQLDKSLKLFAEVLFNPTFNNANELEKNKKQIKTGLESSKKNPDAINNRVQNVVLYGKNDPDGEYQTEQTVDNIQLTDFPALYKMWVVPDNAYITFVGDINMAQAKDIVNTYFKNWKKSGFKKTNYQAAPNDAGNYIAFVDLPSATQSVVSFANLNQLKKTSPDYFAAILGNSVLGGGSSGRLFKNIREDKGWTYGAYSSMRDNYERVGKFSASAKVRNAVTDSAVSEFTKELTNICFKPIPADELELKKAEYSGNFVLNLESPSSIGRLVSTQLIENLPADFYKNYLKSISTVTSAQINSAMNRYEDPNNLVIFVVGKASEVLEGLKKTNVPIKYFDIYGNPTTEPKAAEAISSDVTLDSVLKLAASSVGDAKTVAGIKTLKRTYAGEVQGQALTLELSNKMPNKSLVSVKLGDGMEVSNQKFNGTSGKSSQMGQTKDLEGADLEEAKMSISIFDAINLQAIKDKLSLSGADLVNGNNAYKILYKNGDSNKEYYVDQKTGHIVKSVQMVKDPTSGQEMSISFYFSDFKAYSGITVPGKIVQQLPGMELDFSLTDCKVNVDIPDSDFN